MSKLRSLIVDAEKVKVELNAPEGKAELVFRKAPLNEHLEIGCKADELKEQGKRFEAIRLNYNFVFNFLESVSGLKRSDGSEVTADDFRELKMPVAILDAVVAAFNAINNPDSGDAEKNA